MLDIWQSMRYINSSYSIGQRKREKRLHINDLWKILGRIADDPNNEIKVSQDAEIFIGFYDD